MDASSNAIVQSPEKISKLWIFVEKKYFQKLEKKKNKEKYFQQKSQKRTKNNKEFKNAEIHLKVNFQLF